MEEQYESFARSSKRRIAQSASGMVGDDGRGETDRWSEEVAPESSD